MIKICKMVMAMLLAVTIIIGLPAGVYAASDGETYSSDKRIKILHYDANDVFTIYTLYGYQTSIELAKSERIQTISIGDRSLWQIVPAGHRLFIRPMDDNVSTNMTVITDRHTYQFDLKSGAGKLSDNPNMLYVARFTYPSNKPKVMSPMMPATASVPMMTVPMQAAPQVPVHPSAMPSSSYSAAPMMGAGMPAMPSVPPIPNAVPMVAKPMVELPPAQPVKTVDLSRYSEPPASQAQPMIALDNGYQLPLNYYYTYAGADSLAPLELYDDGQMTYMRFASISSLQPKLYALVDGKRVPVAYQVTEDGVIMVDSVYAQMELDYSALGAQNVYLYNETLTPAGE